MLIHQMKVLGVVQFMGLPDLNKRKEKMVQNRITIKTIDVDKT